MYVSRESIIMDEGWNIHRTHNILHKDGLHWSQEGMLAPVLVAIVDLFLQKLLLEFEVEMKAFRLLKPDIAKKHISGIISSSCM